MFAESLGDRFSMKHDTEHWEWVQARLIDGLKQVRLQLEPARLGIGIGESHANVNRRERASDGRIVLGINPAGAVDRQLGVIRLERPNGSLIALIANYAIHGTVLSGDNQMISGDVTGLYEEDVPLP